MRTSSFAAGQHWDRQNRAAAVLALQIVIDRIEFPFAEYVIVHEDFGDVPVEEATDCGRAAEGVDAWLPPRTRPCGRWTCSAVGRCEPSTFAVEPQGRPVLGCCPGQRTRTGAARSSSQGDACRARFFAPDCRPFRRSTTSNRGGVPTAWSMLRPVSKSFLPFALIPRKAENDSGLEYGAATTYTVSLLERLTPNVEEGHEDGAAGHRSGTAWKSPAR